MIIVYRSKHKDKVLQQSSCKTKPTARIKKNHQYILSVVGERLTWSFCMKLDHKMFLNQIEYLNSCMNVLMLHNHTILTFVCMTMTNVRVCACFAHYVMQCRLIGPMQKTFCLSKNASLSWQLFLYQMFSLFNTQT